MPCNCDDVYDVRDYGALGNGTGDDAPEIQAALDAAPAGSTVLFRQGTYRILAQLNVPRTLHLIGRGATIQQATAAANGIVVANGIAGVEIDGLIMVGAATGATMSVAIAVRRRSWVNNCEISGFNQGITLGGAAGDDRCFAVSNYIHDTIGTAPGQGYGVITTVPHCVIQGNIISGVLRHSIYCTSNASTASSHTSVTGNVIRTSSTPSGGGGLIQVYSVTGNPQNVGVSVVGNTILMSSAGGVGDGIRVDDNCRNATISGNTVIGTDRYGIGVIGGASTAPDQVKISGNTVSPTAGDAFFLGTSGGGPPTNVYAQLDPGATVTTAVGATRFTVVRGEGTAILTLAAIINTDASVASYFEIVDTASGTARTIANPTKAVEGQEITYSVQNNSGGVLGALAFGSEFRRAGAWTQPANGQRRSITFRRRSGAWREVCRTAADQPN